MSHQFDLFADEIPIDSKQDGNSSTTALKLTEHDAQLTPSQKSFNRLLSRIDKLKKQLGDMQTMSDAHRPVYHQKINPLRDRHQALTRELVIWLDGRLQRKGLSRKQQQIAKMILCHLCEQLVMRGDEEMQAMHDKHSTESMAQKEQAAILETRAMMEEMLGEPLTDDELPDNLQDMFNISMARLREAAEAEEREEQQHARVRNKKPSAAQRKAKVAEQEAETTLRKVFRQLASALHPDRENNLDERARKTGLMSEANAAYDRRDLVTLLQIQLRTELTDTASIAKMAEEKIASLTLLLKQQIQEIESELHDRRHAIRAEFCLDRFDSISVASLHRNLLVAEMSLEQELNAMQRDLQLIENDKAFKIWLKDQDQLSQEAMVEDWMIEPFQFK